MSTSRVQSDLSLETFARGLPKAELHVHLEGCLSPDLMFMLARRNGIALPWNDAQALAAQYRFQDLQSFLDLYFQGCKVLVTAQDFYDLTRQYLARAHADRVVRAEMFIGPQSFVAQGVPIEALMEGVLAAMADATAQDGISAGLLVSVHRHRSQEDALRTLDSVAPWADRIAGIGMGGAERPNPPSRFTDFFRAARAQGYKTTVHAGEEGPADYVRQALNLLQVDRLDHGNACLADPQLVRELADRRMGLTVCPVSNLALKGVDSLAAHPLRAMLQAGLCATINSDNPPYFDAYVNDNYVRCLRALALTRDELATLARNSLSACFVPDADKVRLMARLDAYLASARADDDAQP